MHAGNMSDPSDAVPDQERIESIQAGDRTAFKSLFMTYADPLCAFVENYTNSPEIAEELIQDLFLKIWENRKSFGPTISIKSYLYAAARNLALDYLKHERVVENWRDENRKNDHFTPQPPDQKLSRKQLSKAVQQAIEELPERRRQVFKLSRQRDLTYKEIAHVLDISVKTVETHMRRAFRFLREQLSAHRSSAAHSNETGDT